MEWQFKLKDFDGPLDVLLTLIKDKKMDIIDLNVNELCDQYLKFIQNNIDTITIDAASEYLAMASQLILLKSKKIMPAMIDGGGSDFEYERDKLIKQILEYKNVKEASTYLLSKQMHRSSMYSKKPDDLSEYANKDKTRIELPKHMNTSVLLKALNTVIERWTFSMLNNQKMLIKELSVETVIKDIEPLVNKIKKDTTFSDFLGLLPEEQIELKYIVTSFLALLELAKQNVVRLIVDKNCNDFIIQKGVSNE